MRALLIVNPHATSTTRLRRDVIVRALASAVELEVVETRYRGHASALADGAVSDGYDLVLTLGGDGTVNEAINGLLAAGRAASRTADSLPLLAALPGGNANVFARALGLPPDLVDATGKVIEAITTGQHRSIGVGRAGDRYFAFNSGLGLDAEVVRAVEGRRAHGRSVTPTLFMRMALRQYYRVTDRQHPALTVVCPADLGRERLYMCAVSNASPWTYLGRRPVQTNPQAAFESGLALFGLRSLGTIGTMRTLRQMLAEGDRTPRGRTVLTREDLPELVIAADRPTACQVDGEYVGEFDRMEYRAVPAALRVLC